MAAVLRFPVRVKGAESHGDKVTIYTFECTDRKPRFKCGQFIHLALDEVEIGKHWPESKPFTIATSHKNKNCIRLIVATAGKFTTRMTEQLTADAEVWLKGPYGQFIVKSDEQLDTVLVAGGTGISPFLAFIEQALFDDKLAGQVTLHYVARSEDLFIGKDLINQCAQRFENFTVHFYSTGGDKDKRVKSANLVSETDSRPANFYLCGPRSMVHQLSEELVADHGVDAERIFQEEW